MTLLLVALWSLTHRYKGIGGDAELYAVQALARIHSNLASDLFLRNTSQDTYSLFSTLYAWCIGQLGIRNAALTLTIICKVWFFTVSWMLARRLSSPRMAFFAVALLIIIPGEYGAYRVFHYAEDWLTARSVGEALVVSALALYFFSWRKSAVLLACTALLVHPLMALPALLLIICLSCRLWVSISGAAAAVLVALVIALVAMFLPTQRWFTIMDPPWLEVVRERSQFLFLQLWSAKDWERCVRPLISLTLSALVIQSSEIRKLCVSSLLVAITGLLISLIASFIPVAALVQGQAWRWEWLSLYLAISLVPSTCLTLWREKGTGPVCAILMLGAWILAARDGAACMAVALIVWLARSFISNRTSKYARAFCAAAGFAIVLLAVKASWASFWPTASGPGYPPSPLAHTRVLASVELISLPLTWWLAYAIGASRSLALLSLCGTALISISLYALPDAFQTQDNDGTAAQIEEFSDWRRVIDADKNVLVIPAPIAPSFAWFTLERPSYLTVDQSSGVVFSRATALEVVRRSQVLLPIMDPDWKLLSKLRVAQDRGISSSAPARPLTRERLMSICTDPQLGFVVAKKELGITAIQHTRPGIWKDYRLYDCDSVRTLSVRTP